MSERCGRCAMTTCRRQKGNAFLFLLSMTANKVPSGSSDPKAGMAACFAKTSSAYNGTPVQPQSQAMGAARRDPRRGSIPGVRRPPQFRCPPWPGEVVSNTGKQNRKRHYFPRQGGNLNCAGAHHGTLTPPRISRSCVQEYHYGLTGSWRGQLAKAALA